MKRYSILVLLTFLFLRANAQPKELILNGGFEDVRKPLIGSSLYRIHYDSFNRRVANWITPNNGTPDIYSLNYDDNKGAFKLPFINLLNSFFDINVCSLDGIEYLDTIYPFKGNNIVAMGVDTYNQLPNSHYFKEYLQTKLTSGIKPGKKYKLSFYYNFSQYYESKIDFLEFYFSKKAINYYATFYWDPYINQLDKKYSAQVIAERLRPDSSGWQKKEVIFKLKDSFEYLTFGIFNDINFSQFKDENKNYKCKDFGFYIFLDEISLLEMPCITGPDSVCYNNEVTLHSTLGMPYRWSLNRDGKDTICRDSVYNFKATKSQWIYGFGQYGMDSIFVYVTRPINNTFTSDTIINCESNKLVLEADLHPTYQYMWNTGSTASRIDIKSSGDYSVKIINGFGCKDSFRTYVNIVKVPSFSIDSIYYNCFYIYPKIVIKQLDEYLCLWYPSLINNCELTVDSPQNVQLQLRDKMYNCYKTLTIKIVDRCDPIVYIPSAFNPGSTVQKNSVFSPRVSYGNNIEIIIYNRWGEIVFKGNNETAEWDGSYKNELCAQGIYLCVINLTSATDNTSKQYKQLVHLLR
jgi:hypothetical protein